MTTYEGADWTQVREPEPDLTQRERELRDRYVMEYLIDHDYTAAAVRVGYGPSYAVEYGQRFRHDPYVQRKIAQASGAESDDPDALRETQKRRILSSLLREANYKGPGASHGARVSALSKLAAIHGMEAPTKTEAKVTHDGGQDIKVSVEYDFTKLDPEELALYRKLLQSQVDKDDQPPK